MGQKLGLIGPKLAQMSKILLEGLQGQTRPLSHSFRGLEYKFYLKRSEYYIQKAKLGQKLGLTGPKLVQKGQNHIEGPTGPNKTTFPLSLMA